MEMQVRAISPQLKEHDHVVLVIDADEVDPDVVYLMHERIGRSRITLIHLDYPREHAHGRVNIARNIGAAAAPRDAAIVDVDDHDILRPYALGMIRSKLDEGAAYVFGNFGVQAIIDIPGGRQMVETWPNHIVEYTAGAFGRGDIDGIGPRASRRDVWEQLRGWKPRVWPGGDFDYAKRVELEYPAGVVHIPELLATVTVDPDSLMANERDTVLCPQENPECQSSTSTESEATSGA